MTSHSDEQKLRRETLKNDQRVRDQGTTFHQAAISEANENRGRFAATNKETVVGSMPVVNYPAAPNWAPDPVPPEPPLNVDIDAQEPVGTEAEIAASIAKLDEEAQ